MWTTSKVLAEFVTTLFLFLSFFPNVLGFGHKAWILASWSGIQPTPSAMEGEVLTTGSPGKSPKPIILNHSCLIPKHHHNYEDNYGYKGFRDKWAVFSFRFIYTQYVLAGYLFKFFKYSSVCKSVLNWQMNSIASWFYGWCEEDRTFLRVSQRKRTWRWTGLW